jgi:tRNA nucleotidyltransferase (CCA-adding enzyme)
MEKIKTNFIPADVKRLASIFIENNFEIYLVGGSVRDMFMHKAPHDWDMCTNATTEQMKDLSEKYDIFTTAIGEKHGTITFYINNVGYEITTYRIDGNYSDGRHPDSVTFTTSLIEDLSRRDFTMNAIAMNPIIGEIVDPFVGVKDIESKRLVAVGDAEKRIQEDSLRMLRALRFAIKGFIIDAALEEAIHRNVELINKVSKERITDEFRKMLTMNKPIKYNFEKFSDLITTIMPQMSPCVGFEQNNKYHYHNVYSHMLSVVDLCDTDKFEIKMAALLHDIGKPNAYVVGEDGYGHFYGHPAISAEICEQLLSECFRLTNNETSRILELVEFHDEEIAATAKSVGRALNRHGEDYMNDWLILKQADMDDHIYPDDKHKRDVRDITVIMKSILEKQMAFSLKHLKINGNILMQNFGLKPGKEIGVILNRLLSEVIDGQTINEEKELLKRAEEIVEKGI